MDLSAIAWAVVVASVFAIPLALSTVGLLDAARRPQWAWALAGRSQVGWMAAILLGTFTVVGGIAITSWYLLKVRPVISAAEEGRF